MPAVLAVPDESPSGRPAFAIRRLPATLQLFLGVRAGAESEPQTNRERQDENMSPRFAFLCLSLLAAALTARLPAQGRIWIVDAAGGGNFLHLPGAVAAASDGDLIRVRAGNYQTNQGVTFSKGLTILLDPAADFPIDGITVQNLPAGQQVVIRGNDRMVWLG